MQDLTGSKLEKLFEMVSISANKNSVFGDTSALSPGGIRLGAPALTSRGFKEADFVKVVDFLDRGVKIALDIQKKVGKNLKDFVNALHENPDIKVKKTKRILKNEQVIDPLQQNSN